MRQMFRRGMLAAAAVGALFAGSAQAQEKVRIGVLNDQSGVFSTYQGIGSVIAAQMAVEDYGGKAAGKPVDVITADHQNKTDVGVGIARRWYDTESVDAIFDLPNSAIALAVAGMSEQKNKVFIGSGAGTALLTGEKCTPNTVHWTYDTYAYGRGLGKAVVAQGGKKWFFLTADYAFGHDLEKQAAEGVKASGGEVLGAVRHPLGTADYASFLLQAQASGADVVGVANAGDDTITSIKQAAEFGLTSKQKLVGLILGMNGLPALGLKAAQGAQIMNPFYWDLNDGTRAFAKRFAERHPRLCLGAALSEGGRQGRRRDRRQGRGRRDEGDADRRSPVRQGHHPRRRAQDPPTLFARGEIARRVQVEMGSPEGGRDNSGRPGVPPRKRRELPARQEVSGNGGPRNLSRGPPFLFVVYVAKATNL